MPRPSPLSIPAEQEGNNVIGVEDFDLEGKAISAATTP